jgi:hypothetical protein
MAKVEKFENSYAKPRWQPLLYSKHQPRFGDWATIIAQQMADQKVDGLDRKADDLAAEAARMAQAQQFAALAAKAQQQKPQGGQMREPE